MNVLSSLENEDEHKEENADDQVFHNPEAGTEHFGV